jgi:hypothetical protein
MKVYFDTEFDDTGSLINPLSFGLIREDGAQYYAEPAETDRTRVNPWVKEHVLPHMHGPVKPKLQIASEIVEFVGYKPEFWAWFGAYDWVVLCQLYGRMLDVPNTWPHAVMDLRQMIIQKGTSRMTLPPQIGYAHNALNDAIWVKTAYEFVINNT